jgi:tRNA(Ile)-lysidine synthase
MNRIDAWLNSRKGKNFFQPNSNYLLALSGGRDSVVLFDILRRFTINFDAAHINYGLRTGESDGDEDFVRQLCSAHHIQLHVINVSDQQPEQGESLQDWARNIRYSWFEQLIQQHGYKGVITAHHANDQAETILMNLFRGSGASGLRGMKNHYPLRIRPLLSFTSDEIQQYAENNKLEWRTDSSNFKTDYLRNKIRLDIIPALKTLAPDIIEALSQTSSFMSEAHLLIQQESERIRVKGWTKTTHIMEFNMMVLEDTVAPVSVLHQIFQPFGINSSQLLSLLEAYREEKSGVLFITQSHRLTLNRDKIEIEPIITTAPYTDIEIKQDGDYKSQFNHLRVETLSGTVSIEELKNSNASVLYLPVERIKMPLKLRKAKIADRMIPFGMKGSKLLSDLLNESGKSLFDKEKAEVLTDADGHVLWLCGVRASELTRIENTDFRIIKILMNPLN